MDDDADFREPNAADTPTAARGGRGEKDAGQRGGRGAGRGRNGGGRGAKKASHTQALCLVDGCESPRQGHNRFCADHKRSEDGAKYQAKEQGQQAEEKLKSALADDNQAAVIVAEFSKVNPPDKKYARKKLIQWVQYLEKFFKAVYTSNQKGGEEPMTKQAFFKWAENKKGLTEAEMKSMWDDMLNDPK
eukprot:10332553-Lingulodinium_polyedra.AAC.1